VNPATAYVGDYSFSLDDLTSNAKKRYVMAVQRGKPVLDKELTEIDYRQLDFLRRYLERNVGDGILDGDRTATSYITSSTSTTSLTIATGAQTLTIGIGLAFSASKTVIIMHDSSNYMQGTITSYNPGTGQLVANITSIIGSGTYIVWDVTCDETCPGRSWRIEESTVSNVNNFVVKSDTVTKSTTSWLIGAGSKTFTVEFGLSLDINKGDIAPAWYNYRAQRVIVSYDSSNYMEGTITAYNRDTGALDINVTSVVGSGTYASWTINYGVDKPAILVVKGYALLLFNDIEYNQQNNTGSLEDDDYTNTTIPVLAPPLGGTRVDTVYVDTYLAEVSCDIDSEYQDVTLKDGDLDIQTANRFRIVQDILVAEGTVDIPADGLDANDVYHRYYKLAEINRTAGQNEIYAADIVDKRTYTNSLLNLSNGKGELDVYNATVENNLTVHGTVEIINTSEHNVGKLIINNTAPGTDAATINKSDTGKALVINKADDSVAGNAVEVTNASAGSAIVVTNSGGGHAIDIERGDIFLNITNGADLTFSPAISPAGYDSLVEHVTNQYALHAPTGFISRSATVYEISFTDSSPARTFAVSGPIGSEGPIFYVNNKLFDKSSASPDTITIDNLEGIWYFYYDITGTLNRSQTIWDDTIHAPVASVYWSVGAATHISLVDERHSTIMDGQTRLYLDQTHGLRYYSGLDATFTIGDGTADTDAQVLVSAGAVIDDDIKVNIVDSATSYPYYQTLSPAAIMPVFYRSSVGVWTKKTATTYPVYENAGGSGRIGYDNHPVAAVTSGWYTSTFIFATNDINDPIIAIMGQSQYSTLDAAKQDNFDDLDLSNVPYSEIKILWRVIYQTSNNFTNTIKAKVVDYLDLREVYEVHPAYAVSLNTTHFNGLSTDNNVQQAIEKISNAFDQLEGGAYFGKVKVAENQLYVNNVGSSWIQRASSKNWADAAASSDGRYQTAVVAGAGYIYTSSDYGITWTVRDSSRDWINITMSSDGKIQTAAVSGGYIYTSSNYGASWIQRASVNSWCGLSMSSDGKIQAAIVGIGYIYTSSDYGVTWTQTTSAAQNWTGIAISSDGRIQTATISNIAVSYIYTSDDYGLTWTARDSSRLWSCVAMSSDGRIQTACVLGGQIYVSFDYGMTWTAKGSSLSWSDVAISSNGQIQVAFVAGPTGYIYVSQDYGTTWQQRATLQAWSALAMSSDGKVLIAGVSSGYLYVSYADSDINGSVVISEFSDDKKRSLLSVDQMQLSQLEGDAYFGRVGLTENQWYVDNIGNIWTARATSLNWQSVAMSSNGKYQTAVVGSEKIYTSSDYGATWTARDSNRDWRDVAMSNDGKIQTAVVNSGTIYVSYDYGLTWTTKGSSASWRAVAMSSDGRIQTTVADSDTIYVSSDYGMTWASKESSRAWIDIAMSSDGKIQTAIMSTSGHYYNSYDYGTTWTQGAAAGALSSIVMSSDGKIQLVVAPARLYTSYNYGVTWTGRDTGAWANATISSNGRIQAAISSSGNVYVSIDYGVTWTAKGPSAAWTGIAMSSDGRVLTATVGSAGKIYVSYAKSSINGEVAISDLTDNNKRSLLSVDQMQLSELEGGAYFGHVGITENQWFLDDFGLTWLRANTSDHQDIAVSSNGKYLTAIVYGGFIHISSNYGITWTQVATSLNWLGIAMSNDGKIQTAIVRNGQIWTSTDYGATWIARDSARDWQCVRVSSDGRIQVTVTATTDYMYISYDYGVTWTSFNSTGNRYGLAISSDAKIQTIVTSTYIYVSLDYGVTWTQRGSSQSWIKVAMSSDGKHQTAVAASANIYTSADYGTIWTARDSSRNWVNVAMSSDGRIQAAVDYPGYTYVSEDYGVTWTQCGASLNNNGIAMSSDGKIIATVSWTGTPLGGIYISYASANIYGAVNISDSRAATDTVTVTKSGTGDAFTVNKTNDGDGIQVTKSSGTGYAIDVIDGDVNVGSGVVTVTNTDASADAVTITKSNTGQGIVVNKTNDGHGIQVTKSSGTGYAIDVIDGDVNVASGVVTVANADVADAVTITKSNTGRAIVVNKSGAGYAIDVVTGDVDIASGTETITKLATTYKQSLLSVDQMQLSQLEGGAYFGRVGITENQLDLATSVFGSLMWTSRDSAYYWQGIAMSSDGRIQTAVATVSGYIFTSTDYGATWTQRGSAGSWYGVAMSADGKIQTAARGSSQIYTSFDYGVTWTGRDSSRSWNAIAMSADGKIQTAGLYGGDIYTSTDYGVTWTVRSAASTYWTSIAMSSDGKMQTAVALGDYIYTSSDYGVTWTWRDSTRQWCDVAMSSDGRIQTAAANSGDKIYISTDYGATWTGKDSNRNWIAVAMSSSGRLQIAATRVIPPTADTTAQLYASVDYGNTWKAIGGGAHSWYDVAMSSDGKMLSAVGFNDTIYTSYNISQINSSLSIPKRSILDNESLFSTDQMQLSQLEGGAHFGHVGITENQWYVSHFDTAVWTARDSNRNWMDIAMSSNGKYQSAVAGGVSNDYIYISSDYGVTWTQVGTQAYWVNIAMSSDGKYQSATELLTSAMYRSSNYGTTWSLIISGGSLWGIAMSGDGRIQTIGYTGFTPINVSFDYGVTWVNSNSPTGDFRSIAMSSDGRIQTACAFVGYIYTSVDYGITWIQRDSSRRWTSVAMSSDGKIQTATVNNSGYIYTSTDYGVTWTQRDSAREWTSVAMSSDGKTQIAGTFPGAAGYIYISTDYGASWTVISATTTAGGWRGIAISSDGKIRAACDYGNKIYTSYADSSTIGNVNIAGFLAASTQVGPYKSVFDAVDTAPTLTAAQVLGGIVIGTPTVVRNYTLPTAASLLALIPNAVVGTSIKLTVKNLSGINGIAIVASASMTNGGVASDFSVGASNNATYDVVFTNVTPSTEAAVLYRN